MRLFPGNRWSFGGAIMAMGAVIGLLGYAVPREDFGSLLLLFSLAFLAYFFLIRAGLPLKTGLLAAFGFRLLLVFAVPALSDDYFRFLWDSRLLAAGENPFLHLPDFYAAQGFAGIKGLDQTLYDGLNSPHYFTVYPPLCQFIFGLAGWLFPENDLGAIIVMRSFILLAEVGSCWLLLKLLLHFNLPARNVLWYALNPLVIMELTSNLHFEALMIFFALAAFYFLTRKSYHFSAVALGLAVCAKLLPVILLPFLLKRLGWKKWVLYCSLTGLTSLLLFLPFLSAELVSNVGSSLNLYFQKFEFNASIYYGLRWLGIYLTGYNQIALIGKFLSGLTFLLIFLLAWREKQPGLQQLPYRLLMALTIYFLLASIVHPWYLTTLVALSVLGNSRFAVVWSGLAVLSYAAYQTSAYNENPWLIGLEYTGVAIAILLEKRYSFKVRKSAEMVLKAKAVENPCSFETTKL